MLLASVEGMLEEMLVYEGNYREVILNPCAGCVQSCIIVVTVAVAVMVVVVVGCR